MPHGVVLMITHKETVQHSSGMHTTCLETVVLQFQLPATSMLRSLNEQVWTCLQWSPLDFTSRWYAVGLMSGGVGTSLSLMSRGGGRSPNKQVCKCFQWSPPDVRGRYPSLMSGGRSLGLMCRGLGRGKFSGLMGGGRSYPTMWPIQWCIWCYLIPPSL